MLRQFASNKLTSACAAESIYAQAMHSNHRQQQARQMQGYTYAEWTGCRYGCFASALLHTSTQNRRPERLPQGSSGGSRQVSIDCT